MKPGPRLNSRQRWYTLDLAFVQRHIPLVLCPPNCTHNPCLPPVVYLLFADPRGRGRPRITDDEARATLAAAIHALQQQGHPVKKITQKAVRKQAGWPSSLSKLSDWAKRLGYPDWRALVDDLKIPENPSVLHIRVPSRTARVRAVAKVSRINGGLWN
jgi:hypothetical protein